MKVSKFFSAFRAHKSRRSSAKRTSSLAIYGGILLVLLVLVSAGYKSPSVEADRKSEDINTPVAAASNTPAAAISEVQSANLAAKVASVADLSVSGSVLSQAVSIEISAEMEQYDTTAVTKPQIADPTAKIEVLTSYMATEGDTATTIAAKFGVSDQTVRWANNLTSDAVLAGATLTVPAVDGVIYTVKDGDDLAAVATKYGANLDDIIAVNNLDDATAATDAKLLLPNGVLPTNEQPGYVPPRLSSNSGNNYVASRPVSIGGGCAGRAPHPADSGNTYGRGYCTWYVANRRAEMGRPIPNLWGNAAYWAYSASRAGYLVNRTPAVGAIIQNGGGLGHVGVVEQLNADGSILVSEMNNRACGGLYIASYRVVTNPGDYSYIH